MIYGAVCVFIRGKRVGIVVGADRLSDLDAAADLISAPTSTGGARIGYVLGEDLETATRRAHEMGADAPGAWGPAKALGRHFDRLTSADKGVAIAAGLFRKGDR